MVGVWHLAPGFEVQLRTDSCDLLGQVFVKVTEVQPDDRGGFKIGCSIRAVDQDTGKDLDPDNVLTYRSRHDNFKLNCFLWCV